MIKAIALDDEPPALKILDNFCGRTDFLTLEKTFTRADEAQRHLIRFPVDLLFLDIRMPSQSGLDFYKSIRQETMVIFTTAYSEYAVEGFNLSAIDYLLKPYTFDRFMQAARRAQEYYRMRNTASSPQEQALHIRSDYSLVRIPFADILYIEGLDDYIRVHRAQGEPVVTRMTMKAMHEKLPAGDFVRVHRSFIVPLSRIEHVRNKMLRIAGIDIPLGRTYETAFFSMFGKE
ncbi:MAG: response regulator transcription factor [Saprospiraceae bacterium]|nr:response regulator transcription factor [Saprospiraceae bacterium]